LPQKNYWTTKDDNVDKIHFPYRSENHLPFLHVVAESGSWEKYGLDVEYDCFISQKDAHKFMADGSVEFVGGNHTTPYADRARGGKWVYLAQTVNSLNHSLVVNPASNISKVSDLRGKTIGTRGTHPTLNAWLYLKQHGLDEDKGDFKLAPQDRVADIWQSVKKGLADAAFVTPPADLFAKRAGLKVIAVEPMPMVWLTTVSTNLTLVEKIPDIVERFLKGLVEGIAYFKTHRTDAIRIIQTRYREEGELDLEATTHLYDELCKIISAKPYASLPAVTNVYELALREDKAAKEVDPLALWDFHFLRKIDDSGLIDKLYRA
jgi:ABC-type nitrate/sulfonate/bicarbonate transport system substrate-binding protein